MRYFKINNKGNEVEMKQRLTEFIKDVDPENWLKLHGMGAYGKKLYCVFGNTFEHKKIFHKLQQSKFTTCQTQKTRGRIDWNNLGYGSGFTSGYCMPLLMYTDPEHKEIAGRIMLRMLFNEKGKQHIFISRLFWATGGNISTIVYWPLIKALIGLGYEVICNYYSGTIDFGLIKMANVNIIRNGDDIFKSWPYKQATTKLGKSAYLTEYGIGWESITNDRHFDKSPAAYIFSL